jgi:acyl-CoA thioester hydrolase
MSFPAPFVDYEGEVRPEWIDSNDHMNLAYHVVLFDYGTDAIYEAIGLGRDYRATEHGTFAVETHTVYAAELVLGDRARVTSWILGLDDKRLHLAHEMHRVSDGALSAAQELMLLHVDLRIRKVVPWLPHVFPRLQAAAAAHAGLARPAWVRRRVGLPGPQRPVSAPGPS